MSRQPSVPSKHYFRIKGQDAEKLLLQLASQTFFSDWCYPSPKLPSGKELCDLLVVFGSTAIIWQAKNLKLAKNGTVNRSELDKNLRQLSGARRQLLELKTPLTLENSRRVPEYFDPHVVEEVFLISALLGDTPDFQSMPTSFKKNRCHVFTREFTEIALNELDTVADFCAYLREKERIRDHVGSFILIGGEKELLGYYLCNDRSFPRFEGHTAVLLDEGMWDDFRRQPKYRAKQKADEISYLWDDLIERAHTGDSPQYERIARELARPCRFERRLLAHCYFDARRKAHGAASPNGVFRRVFAADHATVCFLFAGDKISRQHRRALLEDVCFVARGTLPQHQMVLGIATEMVIREKSSLDYLLLDIPEWGPEQDRKMKRLQDETGTLTKTTRHETTLVEYPEIHESTS